MLAILPNALRSDNPAEHTTCFISRHHETKITLSPDWSAVCSFSTRKLSINSSGKTETKTEITFNNLKTVHVHLMLDLLVYVTALLRCEFFFKKNLTGSAPYVSTECIAMKIFAESVRERQCDKGMT